MPIEQTFVFTVHCLFQMYLGHIICWEWNTILEGKGEGGMESICLVFQTLKRTKFNTDGCNVQ